MTRRRLFVARFSEGRASLDGQAAHHLARVLRARPGELCELSDQQSVWLARIASVSPKRVEFELVEPVHPLVPRTQLMLLAAVIKFSRFEWLLEKATELGVSEILPVAARRSDPRLIEAATRRSARWEKLLRQAAEQARRADLPRLGRVARLAETVSRVDAEVRILLAESLDAAPLRRLLRDRPPHRGAALAVGPEGGWTSEERGTARRAGFVEASLGRNILRTETAVLAALAILGYEQSAD